MSEVFLQIVNMSISAGWLILAVLLCRLLLKRAPKWVRVALWGIVAVRLVCPFSIESALSLIPNNQTVSPEIMLDPTPAVDTGVGFVNSVVNPIIAGSFTPNPATSANPLQILIPVWSVIWVAGMVIMLLYTLISYWRIRRRVSTAVLLRDNIFQSEHVGTPFVLGLFRPRIYLPFGLGENELYHVVSHERAHIRRKDHLWKPLGFLLLSIHWFNPLVWLAYVLLCRDIELACDEKVIKELDGNQRADYTQALVSCSIRRHTIAACPLAFGEVGVKSRVKSVMNYKKPAFWLVVAAVVICVAVAVCFLTDPARTVNEQLAIFIDCQIAEHHQSPKSSENACFLDWEVIGKEQKGDRVTLYMWVLYKEYSYQNTLTLETGAHILTAITAEHRNGQYRLVEYWEPEDGAYQLSSIKEKLPMHLWGRATDSQRYIDRQSAAIEKMAQVYFDTMQKTGLAGKILTINDVIILSQKGYNLTWSDFDPFQYTEIGSGLYIRAYEINDKFQLWIGGTNLENDPMYFYLVLTEDSDIRIDIRDGGVMEFISTAKAREEHWAIAPIVMVDGVYYMDTGFESQRSNRPDGFDGEITSSVSHSGMPYDNDQSNFGTGYGYQYGEFDGTIELYLNEKWWIFARDDVQDQLQKRNIGLYYLTVGVPDVVLIEVDMPGFSGGFENADGSAFREGTKILLEPFSGLADLRGVELIAYDEADNIVWTVSIPNTKENAGLTHLSQDGWSITYLH